MYRQETTASSHEENLMKPILRHPFKCSEISPFSPESIYFSLLIQGDTKLGLATLVPHNHTEVQ